MVATGGATRYGSVDPWPEKYGTESFDTISAPRGPSDPATVTCPTSLLPPSHYRSAYPTL
jgi:hypothetical protein